MSLTVGSLFSGIGGLDLGLERAGMDVIWQSEIDPYACKVLAKHWPEVVNHGNIKEINWGSVERPDVICGGYPCQPFSVAGHRKGTEDERHLWPWVLEAISKLRPRYAILENVRGHLTLGGVSVIGDLASIGYDAEWRVVSAASVGAPHRRDRIIIVGYPNSKPQAQCELVSESSLSMECLGDTSWLRAFRWPTDQPGMVGVANGVPFGMDRRRGLGNAVVPQVGEVIGRLVMAHHDQQKGKR
jgi:DNA (cytosine-5)-methyltransferase 1